MCEAKLALHQRLLKSLCAHTLRHVFVLSALIYLVVASNLGVSRVPAVEMSPDLWEQGLEVIVFKEVGSQVPHGLLSSSLLKQALVLDAARSRVQVTVVPPVRRRHDPLLQLVK